MPFVALLLATALAVADQPPPSAAPATSVAPAPKVKEKRICKADEATSGTRMAKRICLTEQEWAQRARGMTDSSRSGFSGKAEDH
jgi:predicted secreted protein